MKPLSIFLFFCLLLVAIASAIAQPRTAARPPNIVLVLIDDYGWADTGCYGSTYHRTPNIDGLAKNGLRYTQFYNSARCTFSSLPLSGYTPA